MGIDAGFLRHEEDGDGTRFQLDLLIKCGEEYLVIAASQGFLVHDDRPDHRSTGFHPDIVIAVVAPNRRTRGIIPTQKNSLDRGAARIVITIACLGSDFVRLDEQITGVGEGVLCKA